MRRVLARSKSSFSTKIRNLLSESLGSLGWYSMFKGPKKLFFPKNSKNMFLGQFLMLNSISSLKIGLGTWFWAVFEISIFRRIFLCSSQEVDFWQFSGFQISPQQRAKMTNLIWFWSSLSRLSENILVWKISHLCVEYWLAQNRHFRPKSEICSQSH